jgi:hypothetical protein
MASSRILISSQTLGSSAASVTFSSIPSTYTDLELRMSARGALASYINNIYLRFNSSTTNYSDTYIQANSAAAASARETGVNYSYGALSTASTATANTFGSMSLYIPNYAGSTFKPNSVYGVAENNSTSQYFIMAIANLWQDTTAINSIYIYGDSNFVSGSSFYLYGIKNS